MSSHQISYWNKKKSFTKAFLILCFNHGVILCKSERLNVLRILIEILFFEIGNLSNTKKRITVISIILSWAMSRNHLILTGVFITIIWFLRHPQWSTFSGKNGSAIKIFMFWIKWASSVMGSGVTLMKNMGYSQGIHLARYWWMWCVCHKWIWVIATSSQSFHWKINFSMEK